MANLGIMQKMRDKYNRPLINAYLIQVERYQGPFIRKNKNSMEAVIDLFNHLGVFYLNNKFKVTEIRCLQSCILE
jgi:hypothetical protein